jgi:hypothetical protein
MSRIHEELTATFREWEERTRGRLVYPHPVAPEPPFVPFPGHRVRETALADDGRRPTALSSLFRNLWSRSPTPDPEEPPEGPVLTLLEREPLTELPLHLPDSFDARGPNFEAFIRSMYVCRQPLAFELVASSSAVTAQFATSPDDSAHLRQQLRASFPDLTSIPAATSALEAAWEAAGEVAAVVEFGLARDCVLPLASPPHDPHVALIGALSELGAGECGVVQVLFQQVENPWAENLVRSVTHLSGGAFFVNAPELAGAAKNKTARPLYAAVVRLAAASSTFERTWGVLRRLAGGLQSFAHPNGNELIPLRNDDYPFEAHVDDLLRRQSRRAGMLLNLDELVALVHLPSAAVRSPKFRRQVQKTKSAPAIVLARTEFLLGQNADGGETHTVHLNREQRRRHMHVVGASGTGKTTLLYNLIKQDIDAGEGVAVLDPHGDLIDRILGVIPSSRIADVVLVDPSDEEFSVGFNILSAHSDLEKNLLASDLVSVFQRLSTSWGDQMGIVLNNAIRAFLESDKGGTLADLRRFLLEPAFRERFLQGVRDPDIVYYWRKGFAQLSGNKSIGPVMTRLETFLGPKPIRYMVSQTENRLDFADIVDGGKIFLAKLSQGAIGKENSYLLGSLLMAKFQQVAMGRQRMAEEKRRDFWLYLDEFHNFITPSTAEILSGARKYRVGLTLAHQELWQLRRDSEVASAVLSNPYTRICFRVGDQDARALEHGFSFFGARDLQNLGTGEAVCRVERSDYDFNLKVALPDYPAESEARERRVAVIAASRERYATPRATVEALLRDRTSADVEPVRTEPVRPKSSKADKPADPVAPMPTPLSGNVAPPAPAVSPAPQPAPSTQEPAVMARLTTENESAAKPAANHRTIDEPKPVSATDSGRGGIQHKTIQKRLKQAAEALGFKAAIEENILDGAGCVDLLLTRTDRTIACEITVTNTIDREVGNVAKCLKASFPEVAVVSVTSEKLARLENAVVQTLGTAAAASVRYFLPDQFISYLQALPRPVIPPVAPAVRVSRGYKIKKTYPQLAPDEAKAREDAAIQAIAESMRRKR